MSKSWKDVLKTIGVHEQILSNPVGEKEIIEHIINGILKKLPGVKQLPFIRECGNPASELTDEQFEELVDLVRSSPIFDKDELYKSANGDSSFLAGINVTSDTVTLTYGLVNHERFPDFLIRHNLRCDGKEIVMDSQNGENYRRIRFDEHGKEIEHLEQTHPFEDRGDNKDAKEEEDHSL